MPIRRTTLRGAVAAAALAALVAPTAPALAQSHVTHDAKRDVTHVTGDFDDETMTVDPSRVEGDVTSLGVTHTRHRVYLALKYARLTRPSGDDLGFQQFSIKTSKHRRFELVLIASPDRVRAGRLFGRSNGSGRAKCGGLQTHIDYGNDLVTASIPRSCLGKPRWVRVGGGGGTFAVEEQGDDFSYSEFIDDASRKGLSQDDFTFGPRVLSGTRRSSVGSS